MCVSVDVYFSYSYWYLCQSLISLRCTSQHPTWRVPIAVHFIFVHYIICLVWLLLRGNGLVTDLPRNIIIWFHHLSPYAGLLVRLLISASDNTSLSRCTDSTYSVHVLVARSYSQCLASSIRHAYYLQSKTHTPSCHLSRLAIRVVWNVACLPTINLLDVCICIYHSVHPWSQSHSLINIIPPYHTYCVNTVYYISRRGVGQTVFTSIWCLVISSLSFWLHP